MFSISPDKDSSSAPGLRNNNISQLLRRDQHKGRKFCNVNNFIRNDNGLLAVDPDAKPRHFDDVDRKTTFT
jgi:hypothetical protein